MVICVRVYGLFVSAVNFSPYLTCLSSMMLIWAVGARCKRRAHLHNSRYAVAEAWTADFLVLGQALYHWATLPPRWLTRERSKGLERVCELLLEPKAKPSPPKHSLKFKYQMWSKITNKFANKCLAAPSLHYITGLHVTEHVTVHLLNKEEGKIVRDE